MNKPVIVSHYLCQECKKPIVDYLEGVYLHGNLAIANPKKYEGILGDPHWLSKIDNGKPITTADIPENVFCKPCFLKLIQLTLY